MLKGKNNLIFKSEGSDKFQFYLLLVFYLITILLLIYNSKYLFAFIFIFIFFIIFAFHAKTVLIYDDYMQVNYHVLKKKNRIIDLENIYKVQIVNSTFNTPNISVILKNKKRINFEFGHKKNLKNLIVFLKEKNILIEDDSKFLKAL
jgi:hypothetical protein